MALSNALEDIGTTWPQAAVPVGSILLNKFSQAVEGSSSKKKCVRYWHSRYIIVGSILKAAMPCVHRVLDEVTGFFRELRSKYGDVHIEAW